MPGDGRAMIGISSTVAQRFPSHRVRVVRPPIGGDGADAAAGRIGLVRDAVLKDRDFDRDPADSFVADRHQPGGEFRQRLRHIAGDHAGDAMRLCGFLRYPCSLR
jgi:hypothetical protein